VARGAPRRWRDTVVLVHDAAGTRLEEVRFESGRADAARARR